MTEPETDARRILAEAKALATELCGICTDQDAVTAAIDRAVVKPEGWHVAAAALQLVVTQCLGPSVAAVGDTQDGVREILLGVHGASTYALDQLDSGPAGLDQCRQTLAGMRDIDPVAVELLGAVDELRAYSDGSSTYTDEVIPAADGMPERYRRRFYDRPAVRAAAGR